MGITITTDLYFIKTTSELKRWANLMNVGMMNKRRIDA